MIKVIKVIVAEPNQMVRLGIRSVLEKHGGFAIVGEPTSAKALCASFLEVPHDVVLAELGLLQRLGSAPLGDLREARPASRMLVHSYEADSDFGVQACRFGALGYLSSDCSTDDLCAAIAHVAAGRPYITRLLGEQLATSACFQASNLPNAALSRRELMVFKMLAIGLNVNDVARQLGQSAAIVHGYKTQIMAKMDLPDACLLVRHAVSQSVAHGVGRQLLPLPV